MHSDTTPSAKLNNSERVMEPAMKRRKLRRGTSSCWECKRRKVRCDFVAEFTAACVSCQRRGTRCVLQDVPEMDLLTEEKEGYSEVEQSIVRVEGMVDQLLRNSTVLPPLVPTTSGQPKLSSNEIDWAPLKHKQKVHETKPQNSSDNELEHSRPRRLAPLARKEPGQICHPDHPLDSPDLSLWRPKTALGPPNPFSLSRIVYSYLPPMQLATQIMRRGKFRSFPMQMLRKPLMSFLKQTDVEEQIYLPEALEPTTQPVFLARKLIQLAICLQQMDPVSDASQLCLDGSTREVATRFFTAATTYVTSQDSLIVSIDGLETLMLEAHFHLNSGNYKLSWLVFRRAMDIAQLLGLHAQDAKQQSILGESQCTEYLWFRLIYINRYLSMMLSLPIANIEHSLVTAQQPSAEQGLEKLERIHADVMGRIVTRNERMRSGDQSGRMIYDHYKETQDIDSELKQAARTMPARWWAIPTIHDADTDAEKQSKRETARIVLQIHQYNLLTCLHAPYVIPGVRAKAVVGGGEKDYTYSKTTALHACREGLIRFPILSKSKHIPPSSRGMNFKAFISAATLLLAHISGHRHGRINALEHQRPGDLDMIDKVVETLEVYADRRSDLVDRSCVHVLKTLLEFEDNAANGSQYYVWSEAPAVGKIDCIIMKIERGVEVMIPTVGTIHIIRQLSQGEPVAETSGTEQNHDSLVALGGSAAIYRDSAASTALTFDNIQTPNTLIDTCGQEAQIYSCARDSSEDQSSDGPSTWLSYVDFGPFSPNERLQQTLDNE